MRVEGVLVGSGVVQVLVAEEAVWGIAAAVAAAAGAVRVERGGLLPQHLQGRAGVGWALLAAAARAQAVMAGRTGNWAAMEQHYYLCRTVGGAGLACRLMAVGVGALAWKWRGWAVVAVAAVQGVVGLQLQLMLMAH